jgi:hypothetical protein
MRQRLRPALKALRKNVGVDVARKQKHLKKEHAGRPNRGSAAEPGQDKLSNDELSPEEQEGAEKNRKGKLDARKGKPGLCGRVHRQSL